MENTFELADNSSTTTTKQEQKYWTFGVRMPYEVKEQLDKLTKAEYKELVREIRSVLENAKAFVTKS